MADGNRVVPRTKEWTADDVGSPQGRRDDCSGFAGAGKIPQPIPQRARDDLAPIVP